MPHCADPGSSKEVEEHQQYILTSSKETLYGLNVVELAWRDRQDILDAHGYVLRPRFRRGWTPSWKKPGERRHPVFSEDSYQHWNLVTIDAIRKSDNRHVYLKIVRADGFEQRIARMLSSEGELKGPRNHCVPVLDFFVDGHVGYIVMPLLTKFDDPPFSFVDEVLDFMRQTLEGISFIHSRNIAHRDCSVLNIMMDATELYPHGFHPTYPMYAADGVAPSNPRRRRDVSQVRYYFTDFGIAAEFRDLSKPRLIKGSDGQDQDVPELSNTTPYDPFAVDVFILGNLYRKYLLAKYTNFSFLKSLIDAMTRKDPKTRPTIGEALKMFDEILSRQRSCVLRRKLGSSTDGKLKRLVLAFGWLAQDGFSALRNTLTSR